VFHVQSEYVILEGSNSYILITIARDTVVYSDEVTIQYTTSDLTAQAVNATKYASCLLLAVKARGTNGCGDYQETNGFLTISAGASYGAFEIPIMNDLCLDPFLKYFQVWDKSPTHYLISLPTNFSVLIRSRFQCLDRRRYKESFLVPLSEEMITISADQFVQTNI